LLKIIVYKIKTIGRNYFYNKKRNKKCSSSKANSYTKGIHSFFPFILPPSAKALLKVLLLLKKSSQASITWSTRGRLTASIRAWWAQQVLLLHKVGSESVVYHALNHLAIRSILSLLAVEALQGRFAKSKTLSS